MSLGVHSGAGSRRSRLNLALLDSLQTFTISAKISHSNYYDLL